MEEQVSLPPACGCLLEGGACSQPVYAGGAPVAVGVRAATQGVDRDCPNAWVPARLPGAPECRLVSSVP